MSEIFSKKEYLKNLIKRSKHEDTEQLKQELRKIISQLSPEEIAKVEQELMEEENLSIEDIRNVCDVHLQMFEEYVEKEKLDVPEWHPIFILMKEHEHILHTLEGLRNISKELSKIQGIDEALPKLLKLSQTIEELHAAEKYFLKEENALFPYIEKHGVVKPPAIMWKEHDIVRELRKRLKKLKDERNLETVKKELSQIAIELSELFVSHVHKEHSILFPTALNLISENEWYLIREEFDKIGYCCYKPKPFGRKISEEKILIENRIKFPSGELTLEELNAVLNVLPVDISFVDKNDEVKYFNETEDRIFVRSRAIIGRKVQNCHPEKSIDIVNKILNDFKSGKRDKADFWIKLGEKYVYIQYFAVRDKNGEYLGTLEVTQDIAPLQKIQGEKRIYDEK
ncbi:DUF438 domain-containing protein [Thermosipho ferrireducens]|uniref:DUF438 domain-containing protein n=1 Tax=Thermosipho ferrireducens TaxID=2571116 RepID=A0ABX7S4U5_9BACT|nr:DUF438 domain-containing protein [Thermosipho ferrireducens]QTA37513.1 DUF438 domain-containing protein [Thermosipho ferrireducens]